MELDEDKNGTIAVIPVVPKSVCVLNSKVDPSNKHEASCDVGMLLNLRLG